MATNVKIQQEVTILTKIHYTQAYPIPSCRTAEEKTPLNKDAMRSNPTRW